MRIFRTFFGGFTLIGLGLVLGSACSSSSSGNGSPVDGGANDGGPASPGELDAVMQRMHEQCALMNEDDEAITEATIHAARDAFGRGESDIPLSVTGCTRLFVQREGDKIPFAAVLVPKFNYYIDQVTFDIHWTAGMVAWRNGDAQYEVTVDLDDDGKLEAHDTIVPDTSLVSERFSDQGTLVARTTVTVGADRKRFLVKEEAIDEEAEDAGLAIVAQYEAAAVAQKCATDPPPDTPPPPSEPPKPQNPFPPSPHEVPCSGEQLRQLDVLLEKAIDQGSKCLGGAKMNDLKYRLAYEIAAKTFDFKCSDDDSFVAANDGGYGRIFRNRALIWINPILFTGGSAEQTGTLFHELMHFFSGHDHDVEALADYSTHLDYADQVYACERLCFGSQPNTCQLAACEKKKICEVNASAFEQKTGRTIQSCNANHQVGALCRKGVGERLWCTTADECDAACGQPCESKSISCNKSCR